MSLFMVALITGCVSLGLSFSFSRDGQCRSEHALSPSPPVLYGVAAIAQRALLPQKKGREIENGGGGARTKRGVFLLRGCVRVSASVVAGAMVV